MVSVTHKVSYEATIEDIKKTFGRVPGFMKFIPREKLVDEWPSWKKIDEIYLERASCLLCADSLYENN